MMAKGIAKINLIAAINPPWLVCRCFGHCRILRCKRKNPVKLGNGLRQFACPVRPGNNHFGLGAIEMRAPVRDDTISAVRAMVLSRDHR